LERLQDRRLLVRRAPALLALVAVLWVYNDLHEHLWREGVWADVAWIAFVLMPATFAVVLLALPLRTSRGLLPVGAAFVVLAVVLTMAHVNVAANFSRLFAASLLAWWFLEFFETLGWVVLVSLIVPWVDAASVWRGPTKTITTKHPHVFSDLSYAFPVPGRHEAANLGVPDLLFFALFLAAAARFGLRLLPTWVCLVAGLGGTIACAVWLELSGLPALPGLALGFLVPNADLIYARLRGQPGLGDRPHVPVDRPPHDG
jgi:hypothetical protein